MIPALPLRGRRGCLVIRVTCALRALPGRFDALRAANCRPASAREGGVVAREGFACFAAAASIECVCNCTREPGFGCLDLAGRPKVFCPVFSVLRPVGHANLWSDPATCFPQIRWFKLQVDVDASAEGELHPFSKKELDA